MIPLPASGNHLADVLVDLAARDPRAYVRHQRDAARAVDLAGAHHVLDDLRERLDDLADVDPVRAAVVLAHALGGIK